MWKYRIPDRERRNAVVQETRTWDEADLSVFDIMGQWPETARVFLRHKMLCVGCRVAPFHTISDVCAAYHLDEAAFRGELAGAVSETRRSPPV
ncbi:DUF1858 domain-containing protein [Marivita sp. S2033]|uniref:DUF1858 domain-containing protein n=1 Tax=Marivita sp. S2033 TaxID=3373187 RepID=UPI003981F340